MVVLVVAARHLAVVATRRVALARDDGGRDAVRDLEIARVAARAHPPERAEAQREDIAHDVLHVRRVLEHVCGRLAVIGNGRQHVGARARALEQERVAVVPEPHATRRQLVDGLHLHPQRLLHELLEPRRVLCHDLVGLLERHLVRVVAAAEGVVAGGLVGAELHEQLLLVGQPAPQVDDVAVVADGDGHGRGARVLDHDDARLQVVGDAVYPSLLVPLDDGVLVDLSDDADRAADDRGLSLRTRHAAEAGREEDLAS
mmetsp:Transcript_7983/g.28495  ORF Transcript_7983/g.28495 Transcript_7983/m.28495 type:complete len:258 (-) Transcript_7983:2853-3626(-)